MLPKSLLAISIATASAFTSALQAAPSLTIYNGNFAVVRDTLELDVNKGQNRVQYQEITQQLEPDSVVLRSRDKDWQIRILEQNYLANVISEPLLLHYFEGKTIDFEITRDDKNSVVPGTIVRSGYGTAGATPIIEMEGKTRFGLPGRPLFPALKDDTLLKPALQWQVESSQGGKAPLEIAYLTGGLNWKADYNIVARDDSDKVALSGWVTFSNNSGKNFEQATVKLMAGDVNKVQPQPQFVAKAMMAEMAAPAPAVTQQDFDEYHLYSLQRKLDLQDGETKQVEFLNADGVSAKKLYVYDGAAIDERFRYLSPEDIRNSPEYGTRSSKKVWIMREFKNAKDNQLGIPLPKGRVRFYQKGDDSQLEFLGENSIDHTPSNETVRLYTGNAFDIVGERERVDYKINSQENWIRESFKITLKNRKKEKASVTAVEHLYRWNEWKIETSSQDFVKKDADTVEFVAELKPDEEKVVTYTVHYKW